jgi:hypothetical protein
MLIAEEPNDEVERQFRLLKEHFQASGAWRGPGVDEWRAKLSEDFRGAEPESFVRRRLEVLVRHLLPSLDAVAGPAAEHTKLHLRVIYARIPNMVVTQSCGQQGDDYEHVLVVVDNELHNLAYQAARYFSALLHSRGTPTALSPVSAIRLLRGEIGAMRWLGGLMLVVDVALTEKQDQLAFALAAAAQRFILAHEVGHAILHQDAPAARSSGRQREHEADVFAARAVLEDATQRSGDSGVEFAHVGIRMGLGILQFVEDVNYIRPAESHPAARERFLRVARDLPLDKVQGFLSGEVDSFLTGLKEMRFPIAHPYASGLVAQEPLLSFSPPLDGLLTAGDEVGAKVFDHIEISECFLRERFILLLSGLVLGSGIDISAVYNQRTVRAAAAEAERFASIGESYPTKVWIDAAIGHLMMTKLLSMPDPIKQTESLRPAAGTRFVNWAQWVDACNWQLRMLLLGALRGYVHDTIVIPALVRSGLVQEVDEWVSATLPSGVSLLVFRYLEEPSRQDFAETIISNFRSFARWDRAQPVHE